MRPRDRLMFKLYAVAFVMGFFMLIQGATSIEAWAGGFQMGFIAVVAVARIVLIRKRFRAG